MEEESTGRLNSKMIKIPSTRYAQYCLIIFLKSMNNQNQAQTGLHLNLTLGKEKKIKAHFDLSIDSVCYAFPFKYVYESDDGDGPVVCSTAEFFYWRKRYFVDEEVTVKVKGTFYAQPSPFGVSTFYFYGIL